MPDAAWFALIVISAVAALSLGITVSLAAAKRS